MALNAVVEIVCKLLWHLADNLNQTRQTKKEKKKKPSCQLASNLPVELWVRKAIELEGLPPSSRPAIIELKLFPIVWLNDRS